MPCNTLNGSFRSAFSQIEARNSRAYGRSIRPETIGENLRQAVERHSDREALVVRHQRYRATYRQLWNEIDLAARALIAHGVEKGDRVGLWAAGGHESVVVQFAAARTGAILVTIDRDCRGEDLARALESSGISVLITDRRGAHDLDDTREDLRLAHPRLRETLVLEDDWDEFLGHAELVERWELAEREASLQFDDPISVQFAAGPSGMPRAVTRSHHEILSSARSLAQSPQGAEPERVCVPGSLARALETVAGIQASVARGACIVLPGEGFDPGAVLEAVQAEACTTLLGTPAMFAEELTHPEFERFDLVSLGAAVIGPGPCPAEVLKGVRARMGVDEVAVVV
jgi:fatty-acyl-CoA synthase